MKRIAILRRESSSAWPSCAIIVPNLESAYRLLESERDGDEKGHEKSEQRVFCFPSDESPTRLAAVLNDLKNFKPQDVVVLDHEPFGTWVLERLRRRDTLPPESRIIIHGYGDFFLSATQWWDLQPWLKGFRVAYVGASHRSMRLFSRLVAEPNPCIFLAPFPVDSGFFNARGRTNFYPLRDVFGISSDELVLLYSGRLSLQKNITTLIEAVQEASRVCERPLRLILAGGFDDIGADIFQVSLPDGFYSSQVADSILRTQSNPNLKIDLLGNLGREELRGAYYLADLLVSLSLQHDEDFGMAPAEALCCGTPAAISDWGGFASFREYVQEFDPKYCQLIPVEITSGLPSVGVQSLISTIRDWARAPISQRERLKLGAHAERYLSYDGVAQSLQKVLSADFPPFAGFTSLMWRAARKGVRGRFMHHGKLDHDYYRSLYSAYTHGP